MQRNLDRLSELKFDVLIVGGGIQGAALAREAARRGFRTALVEKGDFGHATSSNSLKILHGGLRYLQSLDFKRMRGSIYARNRLMRIAPHLVQPLACTIPTFGHGLRGKHALRFALLLNDWISWDRNQGLEAPNLLPRGKVVSKATCQAWLPISEAGDFTGAAIWYDGLAVNTERLLLAFLEDAFAHGACLANYLEATELRTCANRICGVQATDRISGSSVAIDASTVINAAGPWIESFLPSSAGRLSSPQAWALGLNIVTPKRLVERAAIGLEGASTHSNHSSRPKRGKRFYFFVPWRGHTMIGTSYRRHEGSPDALNVSRRDIEGFIDEINCVHPAAHLAFSDITFFHAGLLPASGSPNGDVHVVTPDSNFEIFDHSSSGKAAGLFTVKSVKYTAAPYVAERVLERLPLPARPALNDAAGSRERIDARRRFQSAPGLPAVQPQFGEFSVREHLRAHHGPGYEKIVALQSESGLGDKLVSSAPPVLAAEVIHAMRHEMAFKLSDVVFRRTGLGTAACPIRETLAAVAELMGRELGWSSEQTQQEIRDVVSRYAVLADTSNLKQR